MLIALAILAGLIILVPVALALILWATDKYASRPLGPDQTHCVDWDDPTAHVPAELVLSEHR